MYLNGALTEYTNLLTVSVLEEILSKNKSGVKMAKNVYINQWLIEKAVSMNQIIDNHTLIAILFLCPIEIKQFTALNFVTRF